MGFLKKLMKMMPMGGGMPGMPGMGGGGGGMPGMGGGMPGMPPGPDQIMSLFKKKKKKTKEAIAAKEEEPDVNLLKKRPAPATSTAYEEFKQYIDPYVAEEDKTTVRSNSGGAS